MPVSNIDPVKKSSAATDNFVIGPITAVGAALAGMGAAVSPAADAATFTVTNLNDSGAGSLRQAIEDGNGAAGADNVVFQAGLTGTITLTGGEIGISDSLTITGPGAASLAVSGNNASRVFYLYNKGEVIDVTLTGITVRDGFAGGTPGAVLGGNGNGAGIINFGEELTLDGVVLSNNYAQYDGGALWSTSYYDGESLIIRNSTFSNNEAGRNGGAIYIGDTGYGAGNNVATTVLVSDSQITGNIAGRNGGGIYFYDPDDAVTIERTVISGNDANGGVMRGGIGNAGGGGGIALYDTDAGPFTITDSTISGNDANEGGGVYLFEPDQAVLISNTTVSGNTATDDGGGIKLYRTSSGVDLHHTTVVDNNAGYDGDGIYMYDGVASLRNSIVANNDAEDIANERGTINVAFSLIESGSSGITDGGGNIFNTDPQLGPLANNGGPTLTHLPLVGSPVIDAGDPAFVPPPSTDQAGNPRVAGGAIDMGAVEAAAIAQLVPEVPVPALGLFGLAAAALGIGGIGAAAARRRKRGAGPLAALLLAVVSGVGFAPGAEAAKPQITRIATTVDAVSVDAATTRLTRWSSTTASSRSATVCATRILRAHEPPRKFVPARRS
jgi:predicted outer membrane repeat protein